MPPDRPPSPFKSDPNPTRPTKPATGVPPDLQDLPADARFGKFLRADKLGSGGMGEVWKAWDTELSRWVALKLLKGGNEEEILRFKREAQTAGRLNHPNIAAIYEVGETQGRHWIAMQFIPGQTLKAFPRNNRKTLVTLVRDAARALQAAHDEGIVHRDIKPENLMVVSRQKPAEHHLYVMDFGLARPAEGAGDLSVSGLIVGTPSYMAPEQARGERVDGRADIWSLGAGLYELLVDRKPFKGASVLETMDRLQREDPKSLRAMDPKIDADLETIVMKCLEKEKHRRYATPRELADDLDCWLSGEPIAARPISAVARLGRILRRNRALSAAVALLILLAVVAPVVILYQGRRFSKDEARIKRLSALWMDIIEKKRDLRSLKVPVEKARPALEAAIGEVEKFVRDNPDLPQGWYLKARGKLYLGRHDQAKAAATKAVELESSFGPGYAVRAMILLEQAQALNFLFSADQRKTAEIRKADLISVALADLSKADHAGRGKETGLKWGLPRTAEDEVSEILIEALALHFSRKETARAIEILVKATENRNAEEYAIWLAELPGVEDSRGWVTKATKWAPGFAYAWVLSAEHRPTYDPAIVDCTEAIRLDPTILHAWFIRGCLHHRKGDLDRALRDFTETIRLDPKLIEAWNNRGVVHQARGELEGAIGDFDEVIRLDPKRARSWHNRGLAILAGGDLPEAIRQFDESIRLDSTDAEFWYNRGNARRLNNDRAGAIRDFDEAVRLNPLNAQAVTNRGLCREEQGDRDAGLRDHDLAIRIDPNLALAWYNRGGIRQDKGDFDGAIGDYTEAIRINPAQPAAWGNRGICRYDQGRYAEAVKDLEESLKRAPANWPNRPKIEQQLQMARAKQRE